MSYLNRSFEIKCVRGKCIKQIIRWKYNEIFIETILYYRVPITERKLLNYSTNTSKRRSLSINRKLILASLAGI